MEYPVPGFPAEWRALYTALLMLTRRTAIQYLAGGMAGAPAIVRGARRPGDKPNLLFLWTDEQRADTMAAYGNPLVRVPAMNRLASQSVVFDRAYVTQPVCTPSRSSVMTGLWPHQSGCVRNNIAMKAETKTTPELLGDSAYRTGYMGKWHLGDEVFAQHGFEEWKAMEDGNYRRRTISAGTSPPSCRWNTRNPRSWPTRRRTSSSSTAPSHGCCMSIFSSRTCRSQAR